MNFRAFFQRHAIISYFFLAYAIAWLLCLAFWGPAPKPADQIGMGEIMGLFLSMLLGPSIAGLLLTALIEGRSGLQDLFSRVGKWRNGLWYATLLIFPALILLTLAAMSFIISPVYVPVFAPIGLVVGLFAGFFEELGWSGFAYPRLKEKFGWGKAALLLGVLWTLWHLLPDFLGAYHLRGESWLPHFIGFVLSMICVRVIISWVYKQTGSVLLSQLMHASSTGFLAVLIPASLTPAQDTLVYYVYTVVLLAAIGVILMREKTA